MIYDLCLFWTAIIVMLMQLFVHMVDRYYSPIYVSLFHISPLQGPKLHLTMQARLAKYFLVHPMLHALHSAELGCASAPGVTIIKMTKKINTQSSNT